MEHVHEHDHRHTHEGGEHTHPHTHEHVHAGEGGEKAAALLSYMLEHNVHHCAELKDLAAGLSGEAQHQLLHAVEAFEEANGHLARAVEELKKQEHEKE